LTAIATNTEALETAFHAFNRHSTELEASYRSLQHKFDALTEELIAANTARFAELIEKERLGNRLAHLLETLPGAIVVIDPDGIVCEKNSRASEMLNQPLLGESWSNIVHREFSAGASATGDLRLRDGRCLHLSRRQLGREPGEILLLTDVSESRRMSELLQRQQRLTTIGEMTASFAHQVRTPLASALLYAAKLERDTPQRQKTADRIDRRLGDICRMVDDMLSFAAGARRVEEPVSLSMLLHEVAQEYDERPVDGCEISVTLADPDLVVEANDDALKGVLSNLVENALQACESTGRIELAAMRSKNQVIITVTDNGSGIAQDIQSRIFEPFFTTRPQGTGLGLAVVQSVVTAHGGEVLVDSNDHGTTFALCLPAPERGGDGCHRV